MGGKMSFENKQVRKYIEGMGDDGWKRANNCRSLGSIFDGYDTFTGLSDFLCKQFGLYVSAVFGKIYRLSGNSGYSWASQSKMGKQLGINEKTVKKAIDILLAEKLIFDVTDEMMPELLEEVPTLAERPYFKKLRLYAPNIFRLYDLRNGKKQ
jgi:hypothetical protein